MDSLRRGRRRIARLTAPLRSRFASGRAARARAADRWPRYDAHGLPIFEEAPGEPHRAPHPGPDGSPDAVAPASGPHSPAADDGDGAAAEPAPGASAGSSAAHPVPTADAGTTVHHSTAGVLARPIYTGFMFTVGVGLALLLFYIGQSNTQLLIWIGAALFIALGLDPIVRGLERLALPRPLSVAITMLGFVGVLAGFLAAVIPVATRQLSTFGQSVPELIDDISSSDWFRRLDETLGLQEIVDRELSRFVADPTAVTDALGGIFGVGAAVLTTGVGLLVVLVLALYFLASLPTMKAWAYRLAPASRRPRLQHLGDRILDGVGQYVIGQACVAVLNGLVAFVAIRLAEVPFGALLAVVVGILAFIPLVGGVTGGVLVTLIALTVDWQTALTFAVVYFIYLQIEAYFVSPRIMSRAVRIPAAVAVISVIAGGALLGILGALMAIPLAAAVMLVIREVLILHQDRR